MTVGYPDYIRETKQSGSLLASQNIMISNNSNGPTVYVGNYEYIIITIDNTGSNHLVGCNFLYFTDSAHTHSMGQSVTAINSSIEDSVISRVRGPWLIPSFYYWDSSNSDIISIYIFGTNIAPTPSIGSVGIGQWAYYNASIAANGSTTISPVPWHSGTAVVSIMSGVAANLTLTCQQYQYLIGWQTYLNVQQSAAAFRGNIFEIPIPPTPVRFLLVNGATATNCYFLGSPTKLVAA